VIGQTVGNFEIISPLGKGGMGEVWLAQQKALKTKVAVKILGADISQNPTQVQRFHNEAIAVGQIPHAGIVKIFDAGVIQGRAYLVMEYLEGETLTARIKRMGRLDLSLLADFGRQIASVLDATHGAGVTHRDLKPDNIFLVRDAEMPHGERVKVLDFGIAKLDTTVGPRMTAMGVSSIGTPNYMSPEQWHSLHEVGWQTDAYALGCIAMEMATGRPPFLAETRVEVCSMHLGESPPLPSDRVPGSPLELDQLVGALLEKEPEKRPTMRAAIAVFTGLGQSAGIALSTLPPTLISPFASASMQYKDTPRAMPIRTGTEPGMSVPIATQRDAGDSMPFKPTPVQGVESQHNMRALSDAEQRASQPMYGSKSMPVVEGANKRTGLYVVLALLLVGGIVLAIVMATRDGGSTEQGSGVASGSGSGSDTRSGSGSAKALVVGSGSGSGSAEVGSGSATPPPTPVARKRRLATAPGRKSTTNIPALDAPLDIEVCIDTDGNVDWVERLDLKPLDKAVEDKVKTWDYSPFLDGGKPIPVCFNVVIPKQDKAQPAPKQILPAKLTQQMRNDGIAKVWGNALDCDKGEMSGRITITIKVAKDGRVTSVDVTPPPPRGTKTIPCIQAALKKAKFQATQNGDTIVLPAQLGG
jgi:serine/threonine protein kinase